MHSTEGQDRLVSTLIDTTGYFLDIGCNHPISRNNTYFLESQGWTGLLIDCDQKAITDCNRVRKSPAFVVDCSVFKRNDWIDFLKSNAAPNIIDYISLDVDEINKDVLWNFPFDLYEFKIMTLETDCYKRGDEIKNVGLQILSQYNYYALLLEDAMLTPNNLIWEDWWINEKYFDLKHFYTKKRYWADFLSDLEQQQNQNQSGNFEQSANLYQPRNFEQRKVKFKFF